MEKDGNATYHLRTQKKVPARSRNSTEDEKKIRNKETASTIRLLTKRLVSSKHSGKDEKRTDCSTKKTPICLGISKSRTMHANRRTVVRAGNENSDFWRNGGGGGGVS